MDFDDYHDDNNEIMHDEGDDNDIYDEMEDEDFSSDDEFIEVRKKLRTEKENEVEVDMLDVLGTHVDEQFAAYTSEYESSDASLDSDDEVSISRRKNKVKRNKYAKNCDHKSFKFELGMSFRDYKECKDAIKMWNIVNGHNIRWEKSSAGKLDARCEGSCPWRVYASKLAGEATFVIKTLGLDHKCILSTNNRQADCDWLANVILSVVIRNPNYPAKDMINDVYLKYEVNVKPDLCYKAKGMALERLRGSYESHYSKLRSYMLEMQRADKDGTFKLKTCLDVHEKPVFQRAYVGFSALRKGFMAGCRRCVGIDACFLKSVLGGAILSAVTRDSNNKMFPIAWAVVENESEETWTWFFKILFEDLCITDGCGWTFMSDKHWGIINSIRKLTPNAEHRHCARHIYANWKKNFGGPKFSALFWAAVNCTNESKFKEMVKKLKDEDLKAYEAFMDQSPKTFCKSLISLHTKTETVNNNICETFNSYIVKSRDKPIIELLEDIRKQLMTRMYKIKECLDSSTEVVCPGVKKKLDKLHQFVKFCCLQVVADETYEVTVFDDTFIVDLRKKECTCRLWMLTGLPCSHALACIHHRRVDPINYVDEYYLRKNCLKVYSFGFSPVRGHKEWPRDDLPPILPPAYVKQPGRPKKNRIKHPSEVANQDRRKLPKIGVKMSCKKCGKFGHNSRTCNEIQINPEPKPKGKRGRPSKPKCATPIPQATQQRGIQQARQGFGVFYSEAGNVYSSNLG